MLVLLKEDNTTLLFNSDLLELVWTYYQGCRSYLLAQSVVCIATLHLTDCCHCCHFSGICNLISSAIMNLNLLFILQNLKVQFTIGLQLRTCLTSALYKKALVLAPQARQETTVGQVISFLSHTSLISEIC